MPYHPGLIVATVLLAIATVAGVMWLARPPQDEGAVRDRVKEES